MAFRLAFAALAASAALALPAHAASEVVPTGYTFDQATACGTFCYYDGASPTSVAGELTDGQYGVEGWEVAGAAPWVGWINQPLVNIDFTFAGIATIDTISVGSTQDNLADVVLPSIAIYAWNGSAWSFVQSLAVPESAANDKPPLSTNPHGFLTLTGLNIHASQVRVAASQSLDGPWTFIDEVDFYTTAVPEPSSWATFAAGLGLLAASAARRR